MVMEGVVKSKRRNVSSGAMEAREMGSTSESRKLRNKISQRVSRARKNMRMREMEELLEHGAGTPASVQTVQLLQQNAAMRAQLLDCHRRLTSLQISVEQLASTTARALGIDSDAEGTVCLRMST
jgi:hypothetical protein